MWRATQVKESYSAFTAHVKSTASAILFHRGKLRSPLNAVAEDEEDYDRAINAVNRKFGRGAGGPGGGGRPRPGAAPAGGRTSGPPRGPSDRPLRCPSCRGEHAIADCKKPRVPVADRLCYTCGGKHMARNCPEHPRKRQEGGAIRAVEEPGQDGDVCFAMCHGHLDHEGFKKVEHRSKGKPMPTKITMADFMPVPTPVSNSFDALKNSQNTKIKIAKNVVDVSSEVFHSPEADKRGPSAPSRVSHEGPKSKVRTIKEIKEHAKMKNNKKNEPNATRHSTDDANFKEYERIEIIDDATDLDDQVIGVIEEIAPAPAPILAAVEQRRIKIAADTGCVAHAIGPKHLPDSVKVVQCDERHFSDAQGGCIEHYGESKVRLEQKDGSHISNTFQVLDVCRPLHSISMIADNDHDMLFTKECGFVVPAGVFKEILDKVKHIAEYPREGGLYVAEMIVKDPEQDSGRPPPATPKPRDSSRHSGRPMPFTRPGPSR